MNRNLLLLAVSLGCMGCGVSEVGVVANEIVNGTEIDTLEYRAVVMVRNVRRRSDGTCGLSDCTGTFVHPHFILTAAHCTPQCVGSDIGCETSSPVLAPPDCESSMAGSPGGDEDWEGRDGPLGGFPVANDGLDGSSGSVYHIDRVRYPRLGDIADDAIPDVALLHTVEAYTGPIVPIMDNVYLPRPWNMGLWIGHEMEMVGYSTNSATTTARRRRGTARVEPYAGYENGTVFALRGISNVCLVDSGGPILSREPASLFYPPGRLQVGGVSATLYGGCFDRGVESGYAFVPRAFLNRVALEDVACLGSLGTWDSCVYQATCPNGFCDAAESCSNCAVDCPPPDGAVACPPPTSDEELGLVCPDGHHCCWPNPDGGACLDCVSDERECP